MHVVEDAVDLDALAVLKHVVVLYTLLSQLIHIDPTLRPYLSNSEPEDAVAARAKDAVAEQPRDLDRLPGNRQTSDGDLVDVDFSTGFCTLCAKETSVSSRFPESFATARRERTTDERAPVSPHALALPHPELDD